MFKLFTKIEKGARLWMDSGEIMRIIRLSGIYAALFHISKSVL